MPRFVLGSPGASAPLLVYVIDPQPYGFRLTFGGQISPDEMQRWVRESEQALAAAAESFGVFVDMRSLKPLSREAQPHMERGQRLYKERGMVRSVVVLEDPVLVMQFKRIAKETGIYEWERYIDASGMSESQWQQTGVDWIVRGIDPDA